MHIYVIGSKTDKRWAFKERFIATLLESKGSFYLFLAVFFVLLLLFSVSQNNSKYMIFSGLYSTVFLC